MKGLHEKWVQNGNSSVSVELKTQLEELTFNLLTQMVAGKRYYGSNVAKADEKMAGQDIDTTIKALALTQLVAGVDSMANTMVWVLALLLDNPEMLAKAQIELDTNVGKDRLVEESDIPNLKYLQALLKETLRMYPVGPLLVPHEAMEDCHVAGYFVPCGTGLFINAWAIQRDPNVWAEPDRFLPERFLTTNADMDVKGQSYELLPFGSGRRSCPGVGLALQVMHLTLARILQAFELETHSNVGVDLEECSGILLSMMHPLQVLMAPRLPSELYD
ncbi:hypothetical protein Syun_002138 [Stephania yunnanensis]|uniref:Cytochrome P450 n=1 Tax=Stephania yunnanensis TaxID=152371 RepID=A0AAP0LG36_9MAGN